MLRENAENQEAKLRRVRALKGQVEHKRINNNKLGQNLIFLDISNLTFFCICMFLVDLLHAKNQCQCHKMLVEFEIPPPRYNQCH